MAIRFQCPACAQPIEVDDPWRGRLVACPYCRNTVTAPEASTVPEVTPLPLADAIEGSTTPTRGGVQPSALSEEVSVQPVAPVPAGMVMRASSNNTLAIAALVLSILAFFCGVTVTAIISAHAPELRQIQRPDLSFAENQKNLMDYVQDQYGGFPGWMILLGFSYMLGAVCWLAGLICGVIAVRLAGRRSYAISALVLCGITPVLLCCSGALAQ